MNMIVGIDEAGRGPLAGPVAVGVVAVAEGFDVAREFFGVDDSKKLSEKKREKFFEMLKARVAKGDARFKVGFSDATYIDTHGIVPAVKKALKDALLKVSPEPLSTRIFLDGSLSAPSEYINQETIIHGDALVPIISLASISAKVTRDHLMYLLADKYPNYEFEKNKGYGTSAHRSLIREYGVCAIHRRTFIH